VKYMKLVIVGLGCLVGAIAHSEESAMRTWTATDGKSVEALFVEEAAGTISLKLANGKVVRVLASKLSAKDKAYIKELSTPKNEIKLPFEFGEISSEIKLSEDDEISYHMFVPESIKSTQAWPVMFVFDPGGGTPNTLKRYIPGANRNGWALVVSVQSANSSKIGVERSVFSMVDEVIAKYPVDKTRLYASGHSGGSRTAGLLGEHMKKRDFAGLLANGAGVGYARVYQQSSKSSIYALCGSNCFNRWDMPKSLAQIRCNNKKLVIFPGNHDWASEKYMTEGISMLTGWFLKDAAKTGVQYKEECIRFAERELEEINTLKESEPGKALIWAQLLSELKLPSDLAAQVRKELSVLKTDKAALHYLEGEKALDNLMDKHFIVPNHATCYNRADPGATKAALALAEKYGDTSFKVVFERLAEPSVK